MLAAALAGWLYVMPPPVQYRQDAMAFVVWMEPAKVDGFCRSIGARGFYPITACTRGRTIYEGNPCKVAYPDPRAEEECDELGHVNGFHHAADPRFPLKVPAP